MARRSRKKKTLLDEIFERFILAGFAGGFFLGIYTFKGSDAQALFTQSLLLGTVFGGIALVIAVLIMRIQNSRKPKAESTFDFEDGSSTKWKRATEFEYEVAQLIQRLTNKKTEVVGGAGDKGIDIKVLDGNRLVGIVQCKNLAPNKSVYPSHIRDLNTVKHYNQVNIAYLVSTGKFSEESYRLAKELGVRLIDGKALHRMRSEMVRDNS